MSPDLKMNSAPLHLSCLLIEEGGQRRVAGISILSAQGLEFRCDDTDGIRFAIPRSQMKLERSQTEGLGVYIFNSLETDRKVFFSNVDTLSDSGFIPQDILKQIRPIPFLQIKTRHLFAGLLVLFLLSGFFLKSSLLVHLIPQSWDRELGNLLTKELESAELKGPELDQELSKLRARLTIEGQKDYRLKVIVNSEPNALTYPGALIFLHSALIEKADRSEEVLGILAHELGHVKLRHSMSGVLTHTGASILFALVLPNALGDVAGLGQNLLFLQHSQKQESDADKIALEILKSSKVDPRGLIQFFDKIKGSELENTLSWLSTHPSPKARIDAIEAWITDNPYEASPVEFNLGRLKELVQK